MTCAAIIETSVRAIVRLFTWINRSIKEWRYGVRPRETRFNNFAGFVYNWNIAWCGISRTFFTTSNLIDTTSLFHGSLHSPRIIRCPAQGNVFCHRKSFPRRAESIIERARHTHIEREGTFKRMSVNLFRIS